MARRHSGDGATAASAPTRREVLQHGTRGLGALLVAGAAASGTAGASHTDDLAFTRIYVAPRPDGVFVHPCSGERMEYTEGYFRIVEHINQGGGAPHIHVTVSFERGEIRGVDDPSLVCRANFVSSATFQGDLHGEPPWTETIVQTGTDACRGGNGHDLYRLLLKVTVNANGEATVDVVDGSYECLVDR